MIELYRRTDCQTSPKIEKELKELVLAHRIIIVDEPASTELPPNATLPTLKDEGQFYTGETVINQHLLTLKKVAFEWRKYQSDSCYVHEDGGNC